MSKKDFFKIIIKLFGLYSLISILFGTLPTMLNYFAIEADWKIIAVSTFSTALLSILFYFLIIRYAGKIVDFFKLDKDFDNAIFSLGKLDEKNLIKLGILFIGGMLIAENISGFLSSFYIFFKNSFKNTMLKDSIFINQQYITFAKYSLNLFLGFLLITNLQRISNWITRINSKNQS